MTRRDPNCGALGKAEPPAPKHNNNLELHLKQIRAIFDVPKTSNKLQDILRLVNYCTTVRLPLFLVEMGFMNGSSYDGKYKTNEKRVIAA